MKKLPREAFRGVVVPLLTPFNESGRIDFDGLVVLIDWLLRQEIDMLFLMGGSGEWQALELRERRELIEIAIQAAGDRVPVVPNVGSESLSETLELRDAAVRAGAQAIGLVIPESVRPGQDALLSYFSSVCGRCPVPVMLYDPRGSGPRSPTPATVRRTLEECENVVAMKYRTTDAERMARMCREVGGELQILSGVETVYLSDLAYGATGVVGGGANLWPNLISAIGKAFADGDIERARQLQFHLIDLNDRLGTVPWPLSGKVALRALGLPIEPIVRVELESVPREAEFRTVEELVRGSEWTVRFEA